MISINIGSSIDLSDNTLSTMKNSIEESDESCCNNISTVKRSSVFTVLGKSFCVELSVSVQNNDVGEDFDMPSFSTWLALQNERNSQNQPPSVECDLEKSVEIEVSQIGKKRSGESISESILNNCEYNIDSAQGSDSKRSKLDAVG